MSKTKRQLSKGIVAVCMLLSCLSLLLFPKTVYAAAQDESEIIVEQVFTDHSASSVPDTFTYELEAVTAGAPMPAGVSPHVFTLTGATDSITFNMKYTIDGLYKYKLRQKVTTPVEGYTYDTQEYTVEVTVITDSSGAHAFTIIKDSSDVKKPKATFNNSYRTPTGVIEGRLWEDKNRNGLQDSGEANVAGEKVQLQKWNGSGWSAAGSITTAANGTYRFEVPYATYRIVFPSRADKLFSAKHAGGTPSTNDSDANPGGDTDAVVVDTAHKNHKLDAGYIDITLPTPRDITKVVLDGSKELDTLEVTDPREDIQYVIRLKLGSMAGYSSMELIDTLDSRLNYKSAQVFVNGTDITAAGTLKFDPASNKLRYAFAKPLDVAQLANQTVELRLTVTIKPKIDSFKDIRNQASVRVNGSKPITSIDNPKLVLNYGYLMGFVFEDTNQNGLRDDAAPSYLKGMKVKLEGRSGGKWVVLQTTTAAANGKYVFFDLTGRTAPYAFGKYRVSVEDKGGKFTYTTKNIDGKPFGGKSSDVSPSTGLVKVELGTGLRQPVIGIGLIPKKKDDVPAPQDPPIQKAPSTQRAEPGDDVNYTISGFGNDSTSTKYKFSVTDVVPAGLEFTSGSFPAFANGDGVTYSVQYITNHNSSYRVLNSGVSAASPFGFSAPALQSGERITMVTMFADSVPAGFGVGNSITFAFRVAANAPGQLTNTAILSRGDDNTRVDAEEVDTGTEIEPPEEEEIPNLEVETTPPPLADLEAPRGEWSLLNLILVLLGTLTLIALCIRTVVKRKSREEVEDNVDEDGIPPQSYRKINPVLLIIGILAWAVSAVVMLLTQDWAGLMVFINQWTLLIAALTIVTIVGTWLSSRKVRMEEDLDEEPE